MRHSIYLGAELGNALSQGLHDAGVNVEQVVTGHAGLTRHSSRDDHQVSTLQSCSQALLSSVSSHLTDQAHIRQLGPSEGVGMQRNNIFCCISALLLCPCGMTCQSQLDRCIILTITCSDFPTVRWCY